MRRGSEIEMWISKKETEKGIKSDQQQLIKNIVLREEKHIVKILINIMVGW